MDFVKIQLTVAPRVFFTVGFTSHGRLLSNTSASFVHFAAATIWWLQHQHGKDNPTKSDRASYHHFSHTNNRFPRYLLVFLCKHRCRGIFSLFHFVSCDDRTTTGNFKVKPGNLIGQRRFKPTGTKLFYKTSYMSRSLALLKNGARKRWKYPRKRFSLWENLRLFDNSVECEMSHI